MVVFSAGCDFKCKQLNVPVCGSNGKMYTNICVMRLESCSTGRRINIVRKHNCLKGKWKYRNIFVERFTLCPKNTKFYLIYGSRAWVEYENIRVAASIPLHWLLRKKIKFFFNYFMTKVHVILQKPVHRFALH